MASAGIKHTRPSARVPARHDNVGPATTLSYGPIVGTTKLLIVGSSQPGHMGNYLASAARQLGVDCEIIDASGAEARSWIGRSIYWHLGDKRPARLRQFGTKIVDICAATQRNVVLTTGCRALDAPHIEKLRNSGVRIINYSTDDPWNPAMRASWFLAALPLYDNIFTPRRANLVDFYDCGARAHYLPFGYDPEVHRPWSEDRPAGAPSDVLFVGGCDADRMPLIGALIDSGLKIALFGGYWGRQAKARAHWRGIANQDTIRSASATARVCLCLVRRANRDGHVMRSFEAAAIGGCILAEDTAEHREIFGADDYAARYFRTVAEMVQQAKSLVADADERRRLSVNLRRRLGSCSHTYADRLRAMLQTSTHLAS